MNSRALLTKALKKAKWVTQLSIRDVLRAYQLSELLTAFTRGARPYTDVDLYETLSELSRIVLSGKLHKSHAWFEDIVQDTVTYIMIERRLVERREYRPWRHLVATVIRKPLERYVESEQEKVNHLALFGTDLGTVQDRGGLRFLPERIDYLLSTGRLLLIPDEIRDTEPELARYIDHVIEEVVVRKPHWRAMIKGYKSLSHSARAIRIDEVSGHAR